MSEHRPHSQHVDHGHAPDMDATPENIMARLKQETWPLHQKAERTERQSALIKGQLPREGYAGHLAQLYLVHSALESALADARKENGAVETVVKDYQFQVPYLLEDLAFFGIDSEQVAPEAGTTHVLGRVERAKSDPLQLLGMQYVLEGSNNGGRFVAMALRKHYQLGEEGTKYFDPYGESQKDKWAEFKADMNGLEFTAEEESRVVAGANEMFRAMIEMTGGDPSLEEEATATA